MQIPRRVRIAFREELVGWYLRAIDDLFQAEGFRPGPDNPAVSGERRSRVEQYYSAVDWDSPDETSRVLRVFEEVLAGTDNSEGRQNLIALLQRDGFEVDDSGRIRRPGSETLAGLIERSDLPTGVRVQIDRMEKSLESDPEATIGAAKELIEATTKYVLDRRRPIRCEERRPSGAGSVVTSPAEDAMVYSRLMTGSKPIAGRRGHCIAISPALGA